MIRTLRIGLALFATLTLVSRPAAARTLTEVTEKSDQTVDARGVRELVVENSRGLVQLRPSPDGSIHLTAYKFSRAEGQDRAQSFAHQTIVHASRDGDRFVVRVEYPQRVDVRVSF